MNVKDEIVTRFAKMEAKVKELNLIIEKYRQEIQYVCLKTGVKDWMTFLTEIRMGRIGYHSKELPSVEHKERNEKDNSAMGLLNDLFESISTNRSTARQHFCECESPICSEGSVERIKGDDTSRSDSTPSEECNAMKIADKSDPFQKYKLEQIIEPRQQMQEESIEQILKYIEKYEVQKSLPMEGFDTFRKVGERDENLNETRENNDSASKGEEMSISSQKNKTANLCDTAKMQSHFKPFWKSKQNSTLEFREWISQAATQQKQSSNEYTLAIENTKLRRQLKELQRKLKDHN